MNLNFVLQMDMQRSHCRCMMRRSPLDIANRKRRAQPIQLLDCSSFLFFLASCSLPPLSAANPGSFNSVGKCKYKYFFCR